LKAPWGAVIFAAKAPPIAFDHRFWPAAFAALKTAPNSMPAPRRFNFSGRIIDEIGVSESRKTLALISDPPLAYGYVGELGRGYGVQATHCRLGGASPRDLQGPARRLH
jgi:hypothetical protein